MDVMELSPTPRFCRFLLAQDPNDRHSLQLHKRQQCYLQIHMRKHKRTNVRFESQTTVSALPLLGVCYNFLILHESGNPHIQAAVLLTNRTGVYFKFY